MTFEFTKKQMRLYIVAAVIMLAGLGNAVSIYLAAENDSVDALNFGVENRNTEVVKPENTKIYSRNLELYGGEVNVLVDDLKNWILGLLQGKSLAYTIACITVIISVGVLIVADYLPHDQEPDTKGKNNGGL